MEHYYLHIHQLRVYQVSFEMIFFLEKYLLKLHYIDNYQEEHKLVITNDLALVDCLNIKEEELKLVSNIHALEPNYLRDC